MGFTDAVEQIMGQAAIQPSVSASRAKPPKPKPFALPAVSRCATHMVNYLERRGIDFDILRFCMDTGRLYESYPYHNAVFAGMDEKVTPRYAALRGVDFMGEAR